MQIKIFVTLTFTMFFWKMDYMVGLLTDDIKLICEKTNKDVQMPRDQIEKIELRVVDLETGEIIER